MGFPIGYTEIYLPKLLIHLLTLLGLIRNLISLIFRSMGLTDFLEHHQFSTDPPQSDSLLHAKSASASAMLIRELLPIVKFSDLVDPPESCAVCLHEFEAGDEIRRLTNCRHVFHRVCVDRWMDHDQNTCPLCRTPFIGNDLRDSFNQRVWTGSDYYDYGESWLISRSVSGH